MVKITVIQARTIRDHPEKIKHDEVKRRARARNRDRENAAARERYRAGGEDSRRRAREQGRRRSRESVNAASRRWRAANKEKVAAMNRHTDAQRRALKVTPEDAAYVEILRRDPCCYCGEAMRDVDHIEPVARGGEGNWPNLTAACGPCNRSKSSRTLLTFLHGRVRVA